MTEKTRGMKTPAKSLNDVRDWVRTMEAAWGPILKIGNDGTTTGGTFDWNNPQNPKPTVPAELAETSTGNAPDGKKKLCDGKPLISAKEVRVVVFR